MNIEPIGLIGLLTILIAWFPETIKNLRARHVGTRVEFLALYTLGSLLLTIHSIFIKDLVFIILNSLATVLSGINLCMKFFGQ
ncbi:MAG: PQ-loop domain-containing transporter [Candidatus Njordarchaeales archaeon]